MLAGLLEYSISPLKNKKRSKKTLKMLFYKNNKKREKRVLHLCFEVLAITGHTQRLKSEFTGFAYAQELGQNKINRQVGPKSVR